MNRLKSARASAAVTCATLIIATLPAMAEESAVPLTHPGDTSQTHAPAPDADPFALSVPLLDRDMPAPSYAAPGKVGKQDPVATMDQSMEMDHSMHQMPMPGMTTNGN